MGRGRRDSSIAGSEVALSTDVDSARYIRGAAVLFVRRQVDVTEEMDDILERIRGARHIR
jgi:hypothetical protein